MPTDRGGDVATAQMGLPDAHCSPATWRASTRSAASRGAAATALSLRIFLGLKPTESYPEHSNLPVICKRMPKELIEQVFSFVMQVAFARIC